MKKFVLLFAPLTRASCFGPVYAESSAAVFPSWFCYLMLSNDSCTRGLFAFAISTLHRQKEEEDFMLPVATLPLSDGKHSTLSKFYFNQNFLFDLHLPNNFVTGCLSLIPKQCQPQLSLTFLYLNSMLLFKNIQKIGQSF